ncbi:hypothetical protein [Hymenobacter profundi]|uniref:Uncharacterized protein n=1 Tax=Hymenobacter profundi TaxID=1982110 RepID=A0ABS6WU99_9BACT|nr:hypothetical protein [Hymenobacter profundi]MBW3127161.1 hypothetical protein [Hymenobacter profundi]
MVRLQHAGQQQDQPRQAQVRSSPAQHLHRGDGPGRKAQQHQHQGDMPEDQGRGQPPRVKQRPPPVLAGEAEQGTAVVGGGGRPQPPHQPGPGREAHPPAPAAGFPSPALGMVPDRSPERVQQTQKGGGRRHGEERTG